MLGAAKGLKSTVPGLPDILKGERIMGPDLQLYGDAEQKLLTHPAPDSAALKGNPNGRQTARDTVDPSPVRGPDSLALPHSGAGKASDASLAELAVQALGQNALVPTAKVRPVVRNAWLILEGEVDARLQRQAAEDAVRDLPGIRGVSNNILIESEIMAQRVSRRIDEAFISNARLRANRISVSACNHKIILSGSVRSGVEREEAETAAWGAPGVAQVVNRIRATG
jgi:osmotically-inducible protein OsmY